MRDETQIHTHMCYSEFNDILPAIAALDADVITIETSRSDMELLRGFGDFSYPNEIGPGVYDIHSPRVPVHRGNDAPAEKSRRGGACGKSLGQSGLRPENPRLAGDRSGAGEYGGSGAADAQPFS